MTPTIPIRFWVDTTNPEKKLSFRVRLNGREVFLLPWVRERTLVEVSIADDEQDHELQLEMYNKLPEHTRIDAYGNVASDASLTIEEFTMDEIALSPWNIGTYFHDRNGTSDPVEEKFYGEMGCNGRVTLKFSTPIYLWLLDHM